MKILYEATHDELGWGFLLKCTGTFDVTQRWWMPSSHQVKQERYKGFERSSEENELKRVCAQHVQEGKGEWAHAWIHVDLNT